MPKEIESKITQVSPQQMADALTRAYHLYFNSDPAPGTILVLLAQWALETGAGKSMRCYNVGNVKASSNGPYDFQYYTCNERLPSNTALAIHAKSPSTSKITSYNPDGTAWIWFYPKHPYCCFRAFDSLDEGVYDHLSMLINHERFSKAWPAAMDGDPANFVRKLRAAGYFTANEAVYMNTTVSLFNQYRASIMFPVGIEFTDEDRAQVAAWNARSLDNLTAEMFARVPCDEEEA